MQGKRAKMDPKNMQMHKISLSDHSKLVYGRSFFSSISGFVFFLGSYVTILNEQILSSKNEETNGEKKKKKSKTDEAKELLAKYGGAYLATSITLSLMPFSLCYGLITSGVDVQALLLKVGISTTREKVGAFALAYAAHKAASPISRGTNTQRDHVKHKNIYELICRHKEIMLNGEL